MNELRLADSFWREGYLHLPGFFDAPTMGSLNRLIENHFGADPGYEHTDEFVAASQTEVVPWFPQREGVKEFDILESDVRFQNLTRAILGDEWEDQYCMVMFSKSGSAGQAWHQDCPPEGDYFNLNRLVYTAGVSDEAGGQVVVQPGSHREGELPVGDPHGDMNGQIVLSPQKGDVVFLHGHCWHRVLPVLGAFRSSTNFRAASAGAPGDLTDICVYRNMRYRFSTSEVVATR